MKKIFTSLLALCLLYGCGYNTPSVTHLPFKAESSDRWGLIGVDGKILFENEFENEPSAVINGIFFVKNTDGLYEYYTAKKKPSRLNDKVYSNAMLFKEDVTLVTEPEQRISAIRHDGTIAFKLDLYKNEEIVSAYNFSDGLALFETSRGKMGYINTAGEVVISPKFTHARPFSEGLAVVWEDENTAYVINTTGKKQFDLKVKLHDGFEAFYNSFSDGLMGCGQVAPSSRNFITDFFIDKKGKKAFNTRENEYMATEFAHGHAICAKRDDKGGCYLGLINKKGEVVIRPKYNADGLDINFYNGFVAKDFVCMYDKNKFGLIDFDDNVICPFEFDQILPFYNGKYAFAEQRDAFHLIDKTGKEVDKKEYAIVSQFESSDYTEIRSDYVDIDGAFREIFAQLDEDKIGPIRLKEAFEEIRKTYTIPDADKKNLSGQSVLNLQGVQRNDISSQYRVFFDQAIAGVNYSWFETSYYFNTNAKARHIIIGLKYENPMQDLRKRIDREFRKKIGDMGYEYIEYVDWNDMGWDIFRKPNSKYLLGIAGEKHSDWGDYCIVLSSDE